MSGFIDWKKLKELVPWCRAHVQRLEDAGRFPRRVRLGQARVAWVKSEIEEYIQQLIRERDTTRHNDSAPSEAFGDHEEG